MACNASTLLASGYAKYGGASALQLLQIIAQEVAIWSQRVNPSNSIQAEAVLERACESKIDCLGMVALEQVIAQNLCNMFTGCISPIPTNLGISSLGDTNFTLEWTCASDPADGFVIRYGTVSGVYPFSATAGPTERSKGLGGLDTDTTYYIVVEADNGDCSETSTEIAVTTLS